MRIYRCFKQRRPVGSRIDTSGACRAADWVYRFGADARIEIGAQTRASRSARLGASA